MNKLELKVLANSIGLVILAVAYVVGVIGLSNQIVEEKLGASLLLTNASSTLGAFRTNVNTSLNNLNNALTNSTSTIGVFANLSSTTGNIIIASSSANGGWTTLTVGNPGDILTASSTGTGGLRISWASSTAASGITSLNGLTGATQTFATSGSAIFIQSAGTVHTFRTVTTTLNGLAITGQGITFATSGTGLTITTSTNQVLFSVTTSSVNGLVLNGASLTFATGTSGSGFNIATSSNTMTFNLPDATNLVKGIINIATQTFAGLKTFASGLIAQTRLGIPVDGSISNSGDIGTDTASSSLNFHDGTAERVLPSETRLGGVTVLGTTSSDPKIKILTVRNHALDLTAVSCSVTSGRVDMNLFFGTNMAAAGTSIFSATSTCNVATVSTTATFANGTLPVGTMLWYVPPQLSQISSTSAFSVDIFGRRRP